MNKVQLKQKDIGGIPENWEIRKLSEFCDILMGQSPPSSTYNLDREGLPFFQGRKDFGEKYPQKTMWCSSPTREANDKDILLSVRAPVGDVNVAVEKCCIGRGLSALSMKNGNNEFLYYLVFHNRQRLKQIFESEGTVFGCINKDGLKNFEVLLPDRKAEQRAIAKILSDIDDKIELNHQMNKTLESIAQAIFKRWFVDFEFPGYKKTKFVNSLPEGWRKSTIGEELITVLGGTPAREESQYWHNGTIPWINSGKANEFRVIEPSELITKEGLGNSATKLMPEKTTIIAITGATLGQVSLLEISACANQSIVGVLPSDRIPSEFIYFWIKSNIDRLISWQTGGAQQHINKNNVNDLDLLCPSKQIMQEYIAISKPLFEQIRLNCFESRALILVRDSLLPRLMSGKIRVQHG